tara:strand:+ start:624 stop:1571 length:948 start_codon:yes stop_codon:yes gene_type:complete
MFYFKQIQRKNLLFIFRSISKINVKLFITLICLAFLANSIYGNFDDLANQVITFKGLLWILVGILFSFLSIIINAYAWKLLINSIGCQSDKLNIIKIFLNTNIFKYLPGGIWHFISRYNTLRLELSTHKSVESILLEPLLMLVAGLIFIPFGFFNVIIYIICWSSTLILATGFREFIIKRLKSMKGSIFTDNDKLNANQYFSSKIFYPYKALFVEIIFILLRFIGFLCCLNAFSIGSLISKAYLISSFSFAWVIGLIVPAAPGGLGVFESVILFGLGSQLPEAPLLASLLFYRLVSTVSDVFAALVYPVRKLFKV